MFYVQFGRSYFSTGILQEQKAKVTNKHTKDVQPHSRLKKCKSTKQWDAQLWGLQGSDSQITIENVPF